MLSLKIPDEETFTGGMPLSLGQSGANFCLCVYIDNKSVATESIQSMLFGRPMETRRKGARLMPTAYVSSDSNDPSKTVIIGSKHVSLNANNKLIMIKKTGIVQEQAEITFGSERVLVQRIGPSGILLSLL